MSIFWSRLSIWRSSRNQRSSLSFLSDVLTKRWERIYARAQKKNIKYRLIQMRFFCTVTWGVTFVTIIWLPTFLYIKYISSTFAIEFHRWDASIVFPSGLFISKTSVSGVLFFPSTILRTIIGLSSPHEFSCTFKKEFKGISSCVFIFNGTNHSHHNHHWNDCTNPCGAVPIPKGISHSCLLYQFSKNIPFANILKSNTCNIVNKVNFKLICVDVLRSENLNREGGNLFFNRSVISSKEEILLFCMVPAYTIKQ